MKLMRALLFAGTLTLLVVPLAFAWPDQPPDSATIAGPGLVGNVAITDPALLKTLGLGVFEDFAAPVAVPASTVRYTIHRKFYDNSFDFGVLTYVPVEGGYVRFDDGPELSGSHTPYNGGWFRVTPAGQQALSTWLAQVSPASAPATSTAPVNNQGAVWAWIIVILSALIVAGALSLRRPQTA